MVVKTIIFGNTVFSKKKVEKKKEYSNEISEYICKSSERVINIFDWSRETAKNNHFENTLTFSYMTIPHFHK